MTQSPPLLLRGPLAYVGPISGPGFRMVQTYLPPGLALVTWTYLPPLVLLVLAAIAARRESNRSAGFASGFRTGAKTNASGRRVHGRHSR